MTTIKEIFDQSLNFEKRVEKVIKFANREPETLRQEANDYVITDNLRDEFEKLLRNFDGAQSGEKETDCCVWLSGFYGSGKSSFAKYFGLSFDPECQIEGAPFFDTFKPRIPSTPLAQEFQTTINRYKCTVFLVDLAAQGYGYSPNTPISVQLFDHVCRWAGYPSDRKAGYLLSKLEADGRLDDFKEKAEAQSGLTFDELVGEPTIFLPVCSALAHEFYPNIWTTAEAFNNSASIPTVNDAELVQKMLDLIKLKSESERVLFVVDEVGHFLSNNQDLINNLDGFAKNLKQEGKGKAWLIATAQQTLPMSGPLFGLRDRFPIQPDLKASDIREITHKRLLKKSAAGADALRQLFDQHGERLIHATQLRGCDSYPKLDRSAFCDFHPLLPMHFEVLIDAISSLAKQHGGIGLRSAIRCVEEMLLAQQPDGTPNLERPVAHLLTAVDIYDVLQKDIAANARDTTLQVDAIARSGQYGANSPELRVAKALALLEQVNGFPTTRANLAALLHPRVDADSQADAVYAAIDRLLADANIPIGETDSQLSFLSEEVARVESQRADIPATEVDRALIQNRILGEIFARPPRVTIADAKSVDCGIALFDGSRVQDVVGRDKDIRFVLRLVPSNRMDAEKDQLCIDSNSRDNRSNVYLCAAIPADLSLALKEIHQAEEICNRQGSNADPAVVRYLTGQKQFAETKCGEVRRFLEKTFLEGWFIYTGQAKAVETLDGDLLAACKKQLSVVANDVFDKFRHAPENVPSEVADAFLRTQDLSQITTERDPLKLVQKRGSATEINLQHPALQAVINFFERVSNPDGKRVLTEFTAPPYGWSKETTRYLLAALFYAQKVKLLIGGKEYTVIGEDSLEAFRNVSNFNSVTLKPNLVEVPEEQRRAAAQRLSQLTGENVVPLPQIIAQTATQCLPRFQQEIQSLPYRLQNLGVKTDRLERLQRSLNEALMSDGAEAIPLFGAADSEIFEDMQWARSIQCSLEDGAEQDLSRVVQLDAKVKRLAQQKQLPDLVELWVNQSADLLLHIENGSFVDRMTDIRQQLTDLENEIARHCQQFSDSQRDQFQQRVDELLRSAAFQSLDDSVQESFAAQARRLVPEIDATIDAILVAQSSQIAALNGLQSLQQQIEAAAEPSPAPGPTPAPEPEPEPEPGHTLRRLPRRIEQPQDLDALIASLEALRGDLEAGKPITFSFDA